MLNEQALKNVGPSFEEVGVNTSAEVAPASVITVLSVTSLVSLTASIVSVTATKK